MLMIEDSAFLKDMSYKCKQNKHTKLCNSEIPTLIIIIIIIIIKKILKLQETF